MPDGRKCTISPLLKVILKPSVSLISIKSENGEIQKVIKKGEAFIGSTNSWHETINTGKTNAVAQVVFIGSTDLKNTVNKE